MTQPLQKETRFTGSLMTYASLTGLGAPVVFYAVMILLGIITPHYNAISQFGSELSLYKYGWAMITNFIGFGILELIVAVSVFQAFGTDTSGKLGSVMVGVLATSFLIAGIFVTDPNGTIRTIHGGFHFAAAILIFFISMPVGSVAFAYHFRRQNKMFATYSLISGVLTPLLFIATVTAGSILGLMERIVIAVILGWLFVLAYELYRYHQKLAQL
jgi:Protein of unknown function (DUF998)